MSIEASNVQAQPVHNILQTKPVANKPVVEVKAVEKSVPEPHQTDIDRNPGFSVVTAAEERRIPDLIENWSFARVYFGADSVGDRFCTSRQPDTGWCTRFAGTTVCHADHHYIHKLLRGLV